MLRKVICSKMMRTILCFWLAVHLAGDVALSEQENRPHATFKSLGKLAPHVGYAHAHLQLDLSRMLAFIAERGRAVLKELNTADKKDSRDMLFTFLKRIKQALRHAGNALERVGVNLNEDILDDDGEVNVRLAEREDAHHSEGVLDRVKRSLVATVSSFFGLGLGLYNAVENFYLSSKVSENTRRVHDLEVGLLATRRTVLVNEENISTLEDSLQRTNSAVYQLQVNVAVLEAEAMGEMIQDLVDSLLQRRVPLSIGHKELDQAIKDLHGALEGQSLRFALPGDSLLTGAKISYKISEEGVVDLLVHFPTTFNEPDLTLLRYTPVPDSRPDGTAFQLGQPAYLAANEQQFAELTLDQVTHCEEPIDGFLVCKDFRVAKYNYATKSKQPVFCMRALQQKNDQDTHRFCDIMAAPSSGAIHLGGNKFYLYQPAGKPLPPTFCARPHLHVELNLNQGFQVVDIPAGCKVVMDGNAIYGGNSEAQDKEFTIDIASSSIFSGIMAMDEGEFSFKFHLQDIKLVKVNLTKEEERALSNIQESVSNWEKASGMSWQTILIVFLVVLILVIMAVVALMYLFYTRVYAKMTGKMASDLFLQGLKG